MKDGCHTNNILQVHCLECLVVQVMFHALTTSLMTSPGHKVGQILKLIYLRQYLSYSIDQKLKLSEMLMAIFLEYSTSGITSGKKFVPSSKWRPFWKFWNTKHSFHLTSDMKRSSQIMPIFSWWWQHQWRHRVALKFTLYSCLGEVGFGGKLQGQSLVNKCKYYKNWNVRNSYSYVATATKIRFHFQFPRSADAAFGSLIGWLFSWKCKFRCTIISNIANYLKYNFFRWWRHR